MRQLTGIVTCYAAPVARVGLPTGYFYETANSQTTERNDRFLVTAAKNIHHLIHHRQQYVS